MTTLALGPLAQISRTVRDIKESEACARRTSERRTTCCARGHRVCGRAPPDSPSRGRDRGVDGALPRPGRTPAGDHVAGEALRPVAMARSPQEILFRRVWRGAVVRRRGLPGRRRPGGLPHRRGWLLEQILERTKDGRVLVVGDRELPAAEARVVLVRLRFA